MPSSLMTKKIFAESLKKLMLSKPFIKISIGDITKECDMNRNSFYYHFEDKFDLINWIFLTEIAEEINHEELLELSGWEILERISTYFYKNKDFYKNAMSYEGQNSFVNYFREILKAVVEARLPDIFDDDLDSDYQEFYSDFFLDIFVSTIVRWIKNDAKYPPDRFTNMVKSAATGGAIRILQNNSST